MDKWKWSIEAKRALEILNKTDRVHSGMVLTLNYEEAALLYGVITRALSEFGVHKTIPEIRHDIGDLGQMIASDTMGGCPYPVDELVDEMIKNCERLKILWEEQGIE